MSTIDLPDRVVLLDGSMGRELLARGVDIPHTIWSANALLVAPDEVVNVHMDYLNAGADIITTNTYSVIRRDLALEGLESRFEELNVKACELAIQAREQSGTDAVIAGSLPPLRGSYRPDLVGPDEEILPQYREQASIIAPRVDMIICETMSCAREALAAATAACETGLPVWVSFTLDDGGTGKLRSGETVTAAAATLEALPIAGILCNCSSPEALSAGMIELVLLPVRYKGAYANTFVPLPETTPVDGETIPDDSIGVRDDLDEEQYARHAAAWLCRGANVVGGCCGVGPSYIARLKRLITAAT